MMNNNQLLRNFLVKLCEKNYSDAETLLKNILVEKMAKRVKDKHKTAKEKMKKNIFSDEKNN